MRPESGTSPAGQPGCASIGRGSSMIPADLATFQQPAEGRHGARRLLEADRRNCQNRRFDRGNRQPSVLAVVSPTCQRRPRSTSSSSPPASCLPTMRCTPAPLYLREALAAHGVEVDHVKVWQTVGKLRAPAWARDQRGAADAGYRAEDWTWEAFTGSLEFEIEGCKHQDNADIHYQPFPEWIGLEEQKIYANDNGYQYQDERHHIRIPWRFNHPLKYVSSRLPMISSRTPTSRSRFATFGHPAQDRGSHPAAARAATDIPADRRVHARRLAQQSVPP